MLINQPIRQVAYFVPDVRAAAARHSKLFGSGPFLIIDPAPVLRCLHREIERPFDFSIALGQWGGLMIEFLQQNAAGPSIFHDVYPAGSGRSGFHHVALIVDDMNAAKSDVARAGYPLAARYWVQEDLEVIFVDTVKEYGHMVEIYQRVPAIEEIYRVVAELAIGFDGTDPIREFPG